MFKVCLPHITVTSHLACVFSWSVHAVHVHVSKICFTGTLTYNEDITRWREEMDYMFEWQEQYLTRSLHSLVRYWRKIHIFELTYNVLFTIAFDKGERLHSAVAFENFGAFIDTDLAPPKNSSGAKLFRENDVIFIGHVLNLVFRLSLLCLRGCHVLCFYPEGFYQESSFTFASRPGVLPCSVWRSLHVWCAFLSNSGLCFLVYFICSRSQSPRLRDVNRGNSCIWLHLLI